MLGRKVELKITDDASNQDTVVADYSKLITQDKVDLVLGTFSSLLNYPASAVAEKNAMVFVEPAGGAPKMFGRGFKFLFFAQPATAPHQADVFVDWIKPLPVSERPKTAAYSQPGRPVRGPGDRVDAEADRGARRRRSTARPTRHDTTNFQTIASQMTNKNPDLIAQGAVFEDGVGLVRPSSKLNFSPKMLFQTSAPSNSSLYSDSPWASRTPRALRHRQLAREGNDAPEPPSCPSPHTRRLTAGASPAEDAADAFAAAQVLQAAATAVGSTDQARSVTG